MVSNRSITVTSLCSQDYDIAVYGAGYIGYALATQLAETNLNVLLVETSGQLFWESTVALENRLGSEASEGCAELVNWLNTKGQRLEPDSLLDPARLEILGAVELKNASARANFDVRFYETPVSATIVEEQIESVYFAGKAGVRSVRSKLWVDTSEAGELTKACVPSSAFVERSATAEYYRMCVHAPTAGSLREALWTFATEQGAECLDSTTPTECQFRWDQTESSWHKEIESFLSRLRGFSMEGEPLVVSHTSSMPYPVYSKVEGGVRFEEVSPVNLKSLCPLYLDCSIQSLSERFKIGVEAVSDCLCALNRLPPLPKKDDGSISLQAAMVQTVDVLVAGAGTAGSIAGLAAAEKGVSTCLLDFASVPGGVGTVSGITCYFCGLPGGLQERIDERTNQLTMAFLGKKGASSVWHPDAKKIALLEAFEASGASFIGGAIMCGVQVSESGKVNAVFYAKDGKLIEMRAKSFIDSTGDADLCVFAGAETFSGRIGDQRCLAYSQAALTVKNDGSKIIVRNQNFDAGWLNSSETEDLTRARLDGVAQYASITWDSDICLRAIAPSLGIRQSRTVRTDYILRLSDLMSSRRFSDAFGEARAHADTHSVDLEFEDDEAVFYYWVCRLFRWQLKTQLPYRMLLPCGLKNVWVACRAAGMETNVFYAIRMQRDMQRLGEAAGKAAAIACGLDDVGDARSVDVNALDMPIETDEAESTQSVTTLHGLLQSGIRGADLWHLYDATVEERSKVVNALKSEDSQASFIAACLLAMWKDSRAEPRLLEAIKQQEPIPMHENKNRGAYGQEIDIPNWLLAIILLRRCGSEACLPHLKSIAVEVNSPLNVKTAIALTVERLLQDASISADAARCALMKLQKFPLVNVFLPTSYSIARYIRDEPQMILPNDLGANTCEEHLWQFDLVVARIRKELSLPTLVEHLSYLNDVRGFVRLPFIQVFKSDKDSSSMDVKKVTSQDTNGALESNTRVG
jgi:hypothetical protein